VFALVPGHFWQGKIYAVFAKTAMLADLSGMIPSRFALPIDEEAAEPGKSGPRHENVRGPHYYDPPTTLLQ